MENNCPMTREIVVIDDNYTEKQVNAYKAAGSKIESIVKRYTGSIKDLVETESFQGMTAEKLLAFVEVANMLLANSAGEICDKKAEYISKYIEEIDVADKEIY